MWAKMLINTLLRFLSKLQACQMRNNFRNDRDFTASFLVIIIWLYPKQVLPSYESFALIFVARGRWLILDSGWLVFLLLTYHLPFIRLLQMNAKQIRSTERCSKLKNRKTRQVKERLISTLEHLQVPKWHRQILTSANYKQTRRDLPTEFVNPIVIQFVLIRWLISFIPALFFE